MLHNQFTAAWFENDVVFNGSQAWLKPKQQKQRFENDVVFSGSQAKRYTNSVSMGSIRGVVGSIICQSVRIPDFENIHRNRFKCLMKLSNLLKTW